MELQDPGYHPANPVPLKKEVQDQFFKQRKKYYTGGGRGAGVEGLA